MAFSLSKTVTSAALVVSLGAGMAFAGPADDAIKGRQTCMKAHGATMKVLVPMMKGETAFDAAAMKSAFDAEDAACADWAKWWGSDTQKGETLETWAKAEIWTDTAGWEAAGGAWYKAAQAVKATTDEAGFKAAFPALGDSCKGCHEKFRRPKE